MFLVVASLLLAGHVFGAEDPTKICLPDQLESIVYSFIYNEAGRLVLDFKNEVAGLHFPIAGRFVFNLTDGSGFNISDTAGTCQRIPANPVIPAADVQCLPASAVLLTNNSRIGLPGNGVDTESWEVVTPAVTTRVVLIKGPPAIPVIRELEFAGHQDTLFFINQQTTISTPDIVKVPAVCTTASVVG